MFVSASIRLVNYTALDSINVTWTYGNENGRPPLIKVFIRSCHVIKIKLWKIFFMNFALTHVWYDSHVVLRAIFKLFWPLLVELVIRCGYRWSYTNFLFLLISWKHLIRTLRITYYDTTKLTILFIYFFTKNIIKVFSIRFLKPLIIRPGSCSQIWFPTWLFRLYYFTAGMWQSLLQV